MQTGKGEKKRDKKNAKLWEKQNQNWIIKINNTKCWMEKGNYISNYEFYLKRKETTTTYKIYRQTYTHNLNNIVNIQWVNICETVRLVKTMIYLFFFLLFI